MSDDPASPADRLSLGIAAACEAAGHPSGDDGEPCWCALGPTDGDRCAPRIIFEANQQERAA